MGSSISTAARAAAERDYSAARGEAPKRRRPGRGYRPEGCRLKDLVLVHVAPLPMRVRLRDVATALESTGRKDLEQISRALMVLVTEKKVGRARVEGRWRYWRL